ncbi:MAG: hypothetical protein WDN30_05835 [Pararobbsia sp.]
MLLFVRPISLLPKQIHTPHDPSHPVTFGPLANRIINRAAERLGVTIRDLRMLDQAVGVGSDHHGRIVLDAACRADQKIQHATGIQMTALRRTMQGGDVTDLDILGKSRRRLTKPVTDPRHRTQQMNRAQHGADLRSRVALSLPIEGAQHRAQALGHCVPFERRIARERMR